MNWILTADGRELSVAYPSPDSLTIHALAHSLAQQVRFNGHARRPYSVAEHSLLVAEIAERTLRIDVHGLMAALLHDGHEAITGDMHTPGKREIGQPWYVWERRHEHYVRTAFALHGPATTYKAAIHRADLLALATERAQLMPAHPRAWECLDGVQPVDWIDLMDPGRVSMTWRDWRHTFLDRYHELEYARNLQLFPMTPR